MLAMLGEFMPRTTYDLVDNTSFRRWDSPYTSIPSPYSRESFHQQCMVLFNNLVNSLRRRTMEHTEFGPTPRTIPAEREARKEAEGEEDLAGALHFESSDRGSRMTSPSTVNFLLGVE